MHTPTSNSSHPCSHYFVGFGLFQGSPPVSLDLVLLGALVAAILLVKSLLAKSRRNPRGLPLPPGPRGVPILGNLLQIPKEKPWVAYSEWSKRYGDAIYLETAGQPVLILNKLSDVVELLERRAPYFSDRPSPHVFEMAKVGWTMGIMNYGSRWRSHRRTFHQQFHQRTVVQYRPIIEDECLKFHRRLLVNPKAFLKETRFYFGCVIMRVSYGVDDYEYNKDLIDHAEKVLHGVVDILTPGRFLVGPFPFLKYLPPWIPGTAWKKRLADIASSADTLVIGSFNGVKERLQNGQQNEFLGIGARLVNELPPETSPDYKLQEEIAMSTTITAYLGGADTTVSSAHALFFALAANPEVQRKAQEQIEGAVGAYQLPTPADCERLPYVQAIVKELSRWHSVVPGGISHVSSLDQEWNGYFIPKGTTVLGNTWAIMHDPERFEEPLTFKPERYLKDGKINPSVLDPEVAAICPGRHFSHETLTYMTACLLAIYEIKPPKGPGGEALAMGQLQVTNDSISVPLPFDCDIVPRSERHAALLSM
ncbi:cytochrome P450 [Coprinopsis cinerea okayama7|uniref:Cytochrome P450 n=1 Tax=Coprinopsis cinerea (strain Okayama-7 / 130 / ATCC MYA-4618 / FGSC 9003) TaxID=240176 RepID=A8PAG6_COPC7|nr:cytochrome P450 [Coprinopsis cinerea okayama7\|eukprot:XP_001839984.2 cytochrome P450 [Coprinopsis cinerea okayama7\